MATCLDPQIRFRALIPPGPVEADGVTETLNNFERWFGGGDAFEVVDATIGEVGSRLYLRWRVRMWASTDPTSSRVAEQHAFATCGASIRALDLVCSGFQMEPTAPSCVAR